MKRLARPARRVLIAIAMAGLGLVGPIPPADAASRGSGGPGFTCYKDHDANVEEKRLWSAFGNVRCTEPISRILIEGELVQNGRQRGPTIDVDARDTNFAGDSFEYTCDSNCRGSWKFQLTIIVQAPPGASWTYWEQECRPVERYTPRQLYCVYYKDFVF